MRLILGARFAVAFSKKSINIIYTRTGLDRNQSKRTQGEGLQVDSPYGEGHIAGLLPEHIYSDSAEAPGD
jgi:hypothetical protein